jgi:hypothetical protein
MFRDLWAFLISLQKVQRTRTLILKLFLVSLFVLFFGVSLNSSAQAAPVTESLLDSSPTSQTPYSPNPNPGEASINVGVNVSAHANGYITAVRFYKHAQSTQAHTANVWSSTGTLLATKVFATETA